MKTYAMILQNRVIGILTNQETEPRWPPDPAGNPVTAIHCDDTVTIGMMYDHETNTFYEPVYTELEEQEYVENEYEQYYNMVNAAIFGGE